MAMDGVRPSSQKGGFAARASNRTDGASGGRMASEMRREQMPQEQGTDQATGRSSVFLGAQPGSPSGQQRHNLQRVKRLAAITAAATALAFVSIAYGLWASVASGSAVEAATAGAMPTLVATSDIHAGDVLTSDSFSTESIPAAFRTSDALDSEAFAEGGLEGRRALVDMPAGTQVSSAFVTGVGDGNRLAAQLQLGMEAVTIGVDGETGLAGHVRAFDVVRIVSAEGASSGTSLLSTVCERARVLAVGEAAGEAEGGSYAFVTVEVGPSEANAIREAQYAGRVSLVLLASEDALRLGDNRG